MNMANAIINAEGAVLGRLASLVAQRLLHGEDITIINAEKSIITGSKDHILGKFEARRHRRNPRKGPHQPRMPDRIFRRAVRGMLPYQYPRGRVAYKLLHVYIGVPTGVDDKRAETYPAKLGTDRFMVLGEIAHLLGARF
jgi:large subunit ribosomal protein L13